MRSIVFGALLVGSSLVATSAHADVTPFGGGAVTVGPGVYHYFSGGGINRGTEWAGFSWHANLYGGINFGRFGLGLSAMFTPLLNFANGGVAFAPGGYAGILAVFELAERLRLDITAGFGGMGAKGVFGGLGPGWSAGLSYAIVKVDRVNVDLSFRMLVAYGQETDNARHDPGMYLAPQVGVGFTYW